MKIRIWSRYILVGLALIVLALGWTTTYADNVQMTSVGSTFNRGDFTATNAFFWSSLDLSQLAGIDTGSTQNYIEVLDAAGKKAIGYLAGVGAGETLGSELIINQVDRDFSGSSHWTNGTFVGYDETGDLSVTADGINQFCYLETAYCNSLISAALYNFLYDHTSISGSFTLALQNAAQVLGTFINGSNALRFTYAGGSNDYLQLLSSANPSQGNFDNFSWKRITDPPATAVHIVSALNGTTRNWASVEVGFNPNTITSWIIYSSIPMTRIGGSNGPINFRFGMSNSGPINSGMIK